MSAKTLPSNARAIRFRAPDPLGRLEAAAREHGDVVPLREGWLFCHPDAIRDILVVNDKRMKKSPALKFVKFTLGNGLLTSEGALHQRQRRLIQPSLHPGRLAGYAEAMTRHAAEASDTWRDGREIALHREMMRLTMRIVAEALFGAAVGPEADVISDAMDRNVEMFRRVTGPWGLLRVALPTPFNIGYLFARRRLVGTLRAFIAKRRASGVLGDDLLARLLTAQDPEGGGGMSEQQLVDECVTLFAAGHETTASALTFTFWLLSQNPDAAARLYEEVDRVLGARSRPEMMDLPSLTYARMVMAESMRLYPPAWLTAREVTESCEIAGYHVPRGALVFISQWLTHRDARWWPEPERFDPERFAPHAADARPRWAYFPFGGGTRQCVGESFAWAEATLVLATLARQWTMSPVDTGPLALLPGITLRPEGDVRMKVKQRERVAVAVV